MAVWGDRRRLAGRGCECNILHYGMRTDRTKWAALALLAVTVAWGSTFVVVQDALAHISVMNFLGWRFLVAGAVLAVLRPRKLAELGARGWGRGAVLGLALAGGYVAQTYGLLYTSAAVSGFLTGLQVVFTPLLAWGLLGQRPGYRASGATAMAAVGLAVMSLRHFSLGTGELLTLLAAALFALQIVGLSHWATRREAYGLATVQLLVVAACSMGVSAGQGLQVPTGAQVWSAVLVTALLATAVAFVVQTWAQAQLSPTRTAVVLTMEPVFAAATSWAVGQSISWAVLVGGSLVVTAMLVVDALPQDLGRVRLRNRATVHAEVNMAEVNMAEVGVAEVGVTEVGVAEVGAHGLHETAGPGRLQPASPGTLARQDLGSH